MSKLRYKEGGVWKSIAPSQKEFDDNKAEVTASLADTGEKLSISTNTGVNVESFKRTIPEASDNPRIQRAIDSLSANGGGILTLPKKEYEITGTVIVKEGITIMGYGAKFVNRTNPVTFLDVKSNVSIFGLGLEGNGHTTLNSNGVGMKIVGTDVDNRIKNVRIYDTEFKNIAYHGIYSVFSEDVFIQGFKMLNIGYAGIVGVSVKQFDLSKGIIKGITSNGINGYGVIYTRNDAYSDLVAYPRSSDCYCDNVIVEDNPVWEGLDTHAGNNINFTNCTTRNCRVGVALVMADYSQTQREAPLNCTVSNCTIFGMGANSGIVIAGAQGASIDAPIQLAQGCKLIGNTVYNGGAIGNANSGGIHATNTSELTLANNTLIECHNSGIVMNSGNKGFTIMGNTVVDAHSQTSATTACIYIIGDYNSGYIGGNSLIRRNQGLNTYVSETGIGAIATKPNSSITIGANVNNCPVQLYNLRGQEVSYGTLGNKLNIFSGSGTPEGTIVANPGSLYINLNAGTSTTFYVKETGTSNVGWKAK